MPSGMNNNEPITRIFIIERIPNACKYKQANPALIQYIYMNIYVNDDDDDERQGTHAHAFNKTHSSMWIPLHERLQYVAVLCVHLSIHSHITAVAV